MLTTPTTTEYSWPLPADAKSVLHFYTHNRIQLAARDVLSAELSKVYFEFARFYPDSGSSLLPKGSRLGISPEELADLVAGRVRAAILLAACVEDPALIENEKHELEILRTAKNVAA